MNLIKKQNLRQNILSFIPFWFIISSLNDTSKKGSHDTANLILSNPEQVNIQFCQCSWYLIKRVFGTKFPFSIITMPQIDDISKMKQHDTPFLISSNGKHICIYVCAKFYDIWTNIKDLINGNIQPLPPYTAILQAKNLSILVLNNGHFEGNSCELIILSQWICDLDILKVLKK